MAHLARRILNHPATRLLLSIVLAVLLGALLTVGGRLLGWKHLPSGAVGMGLLSVLQATCVVLALVLVGRWVEKRPPSELGLSPQGALPDYGRGLLLGAGLMSAVVGLLALVGWFHLTEAPSRSIPENASGALAWTAVFIVSAFFEEVLFRGIAFRLLEEWLGSALALAISSAFFGFVHLGNPNSTWFAALAIALEAGLLLGAAYMLTRSLWFATGLHLAWNWSQGVLYGVAVSGMQVTGLLKSRVDGPELWTGGAFGVEASLLALLLCFSAGLLLLRAAVKRGQWVPFLPRRRARSLPAPA